MRLDPLEILVNCANRLKARSSELGPGSEALASELFIIHSILKYLAREWNNSSECNLLKAAAINELYPKLAPIDGFAQFTDTLEANKEANTKNKLQPEAIVVELLDIINHGSLPAEQVNTVISGIIECLDVCNQAERKMFS